MVCSTLPQGQTNPAPASRCSTGQRATEEDWPEPQNTDSRSWYGDAAASDLLQTVGTKRRISKCVTPKMLQTPRGSSAMQ